MCGILGAIRTKGFCGSSDFDRFVRLTNIVTYRGPDDCGFKALNISENCDGEARDRFDVFLGHRRLSIIDLSSAGHQPMTDGKGRWIIYNGEIFNYLELRTELQEAGHCFKTETDTEVILHVYDEYGENGFEKLNGMWAFAIADLPGKRIVLSRDRFSMKPLYLLELKNDFYFASEIKQLLPLLPKREVQPEVMRAYLSQGLVDHTTDTFFRGISKIPAKTNFVICLNTGKTHTQQYWDYAAPGRANGHDPVETFRQLFVDSVRIRLRSDVKVGILLSGGLDSSGIAAVVHGLAGGKLESYSVVSNDGQYSEEKYIDALCQATGIKNQKLLIQIPDVLKALERVVYHSDEPFVSFSAIAHFKILEKIKQETDVTVLLSGQGGDETMLGYSKFFFFYIRELIANGQYPKAFAQFFWSILRRTVVRQFRLGEAKRYLPSPWRNGHQQAFIRLSGAHEPIWKCDGLRDRQIADLDRYSVPVLTHYEDRNPMAHSLELRHPFLDHRLVNFLVNLPAEWKIRNGWTKYVMRESLPELPRPIRWRKDKQGFILPEELWLKRDLSPLIKKTFRKSALAELGILDDREFLHYYEQFQQDKSNIWYTDISRAVIAETWARQFIA